MISYEPTALERDLCKQFMTVYRDYGFGENVLKVTHEDFLSFIYIGKLCEVVFCRALEERGIQFDSTGQLIPIAGDHRKGADLVLTKINKEVDIKAAHKANHTRLLVREDQFSAHAYDFYIGAKFISDKRIDFLGYATGKMLSMVRPKNFGYGMCRYYPLASLRSIEDFFSIAENKEGS